MEVIDNLAVKPHTKNGNGVKTEHKPSLSKKERQLEIKMKTWILTEEYNSIVKKSKQYKTVPEEMLTRAKELLAEMRALRIFRPR